MGAAVRLYGPKQDHQMLSSPLLANVREDCLLWPPQMHASGVTRRSLLNALERQEVCPNAGPSAWTAPLTLTVSCS